MKTHTLVTNPGFRALGLRVSSMDHRACSPEGRTPECASAPVSLDVALKPHSALSYEFDDLICRMVDKHGWTEEKARSVFGETKQFLVNAAVSRIPTAPSKDVDEVWHNFILYTIEYAEFCQRYFGKFIHHVPKRRGETLAVNCQSGNCDARSCITPAGRA